MQSVKCVLVGGLPCRLHRQATDEVCKCTSLPPRGPRPKFDSFNAGVGNYPEAGATLCQPGVPGPQFSLCAGQYGLWGFIPARGGRRCVSDLLSLMGREENGPAAQEEPTLKEQTSLECLSPWKPSSGSSEAASGTQLHTQLLACWPGRASGQVVQHCIVYFKTRSFPDRPLGRSHFHTKEDGGGLFRQTEHPGQAAPWACTHVGTCAHARAHSTPPHAAQPAQQVTYLGQKYPCV